MGGVVNGVKTNYAQATTSGIVNNNVTQNQFCGAPIWKDEERGQCYPLSSSFHESASGQIC